MNYETRMPSEPTWLTATGPYHREPDDIRPPHGRLLFRRAKGQDEAD